MISETTDGAKGEILLEMRGLRIEGQSDEQWHEIVRGVDVTLRRGEVLGLIGESGAGKSTIGIASMGYAKPGCRIAGGSILFDGQDLRAASEDEDWETFDSLVEEAPKRPLRWLARSHLGW